MKGYVSRHLNRESIGCEHNPVQAGKVQAFQLVKDYAPGIIRKVVEGQQSLALDAKADREALIRDLIEALC